jgi:fatty-acyl-CoA synthase
VIPVADPRYDEVGWAFVIPAPGAVIDEATLRAFAAERLANYKVPKTFLVREALPLLPIGKVDKHALREEVRQLSGAR